MLNRITTGPPRFYSFTDPNVKLYGFTLERKEWTNPKLSRFVQRAKLNYSAGLYRPIDNTL